MHWALIAALIFTNICWAYVFIRRDRVSLDIAKLIASKTVSEYAWLKKLENQPKVTPKPGPGYDSVWENEDET